MSTYGEPATDHPYEAGSDAVASLYQTWVWNTCAVPEAPRVSIRSVQPAGGVTVAGSASTSIVAISRSPAATPAGRATVVPFVTDVVLRNVIGGGGAFVVVNVKSPDVLVWPKASLLSTR